MEQQTKSAKTNYQHGQHTTDPSSKFKTKHQAESTKGQEIMRYQQYSIRKLTINDKQKALELLVREYADQEPLSNGFCRKFPQRKKDLQRDWTNFYGSYMDYSIANGSGVAMFDLNNNQELVGVSITRDITYFPESFKKDILSSFNSGSATMAMQELIIKKTKPEQRQLMKTKGIVLDIWGVAIKKEHMGKQLLHRMMLANEELGKRCGFKYGYIYACNVKSGIAGKKIGYEKIGEYDSHQLVVDGKRPFQMVDEGNRYSSIWLKKWE